jgi:Phosphotransferase enzyme family
VSASSTAIARSALGCADVSDSELAGIVAVANGVSEDRVELLTAIAEVVPYDLEALMTAGRYWVHGTTQIDKQVKSFRFFVKHVQSVARSPILEMVPPQMRALLLDLLPWETEPRIYRSDLVSRLPEGLAMPAAYAVRDLDVESAAIWLEAVPSAETTWDVERFAHAAYLLGRLAASSSVRPLARISGGLARRTIRGFAEGRLVPAVLPPLASDELWQHPLVAGSFDDALRTRLVAAADAVWSIVEELETMPTGTSHGDACPRNLMVRLDSEDLTLIDFGFWGEAPLGFDLAQLLLAEVQMGERSAHDLDELERRCLPAYVRGLRAEGCEVDEALVRRAHALVMLVFCGYSAVPFEQLGQPPTPHLARIARGRAHSANFILDLVEATA